jgi:hypothetical protein
MKAERMDDRETRRRGRMVIEKQIGKEGIKVLWEGGRI